ncbi:MAG: DoxX family protein [Chitinophagaceae bacterium]|nr:DoxX family protein [Chitinophagaceae bacterium]MBK8311599.1 DoxX family protein [Chitinophagaceae bacterium]MBK8605710.1 DoxX family protein [Chitinophagaceae bacterium]MBP6477343.1 DoxX family protein [Chitinophagaceae bacterium]MBP7107549.1 DoxX family protein [Chitinophagaceae bacterium]
MKIAVTVIRIIVGLLFVFSGLVKANDPLGLSYKMQEFFEIWNLHQFNSWTLLMSVLMNAFEIIAGTALIVGWRIKLFSWLLLLLIVFFTFLTGYTYITGMPKNCGCFGDCLPISSKTSFLKDVALTIMIVFLFWKQKYIKPFLSNSFTTIKMIAVTIFAFGFQWYTLNYMPVVDCMPFKVGNNIPEKMKMPPNAIPDSTVITFVYDKNGQTVEFTATDFPADFKVPPYKLIKRYDKIIRKGSNNEPPIKGFALSGESKIDSTAIVLSQPYAILLFIENFSIPVSKWDKKFAEVYAAAKEKNIPVYIVTSQPDIAAKEITKTAFADIIILSCDFTAVRTAARVSPNLYLLKEGTILNKWSRSGFGSALKSIEPITALPKKEVPIIDTTINIDPIDSLNNN